VIARRAMVVAAATVVLAACSADVLPSAIPSLPSASLPLTPGPSTSPSATPTPTPSATPNEADVPRFEVGTFVSSRVSVRIRDLPGTQWGIAATLPPSSLVRVVLGPLLTGGFGWYLVSDADAAAPTFREGWVAAGFAPNAFLAPQPSATPPPNSPTFVAGYTGVTDGDLGPFRLEGSTALRWAIALPSGAPPGTTCQFTGTLSAGGGQPVTFVNTSTASTPAPGTVQPSFFASHPALTGDLSGHVQSDCSWALSVVRLPL
jgi:hypothetical protein